MLMGEGRGKRWSPRNESKHYDCTCQVMRGETARGEGRKNVQHLHMHTQIWILLVNGWEMGRKHACFAAFEVSRSIYKFIL